MEMMVIAKPPLLATRDGVCCPNLKTDCASNNGITDVCAHRSKDSTETGVVQMLFLMPIPLQRVPLGEGQSERAGLQQCLPAL